MTLSVIVLHELLACVKKLNGSYIKCQLVLYTQRIFFRLSHKYETRFYISQYRSSKANAIFEEIKQIIISGVKVMLPSKEFSFE
jgi:hypothetical protein